jgi:FMN-dependent oxidoreductase (nitrilotriacetate monooxygenase family)
VEDREHGVFADPAKVHDIGHEGRFFRVPGAHISEPSPQRTPVIYQAGASPRGVAFAADHAEAIFVAAPSKEVLAGTVRRIRDALEAAGRDRHAARIYTLVTVITGATSEEALAKEAEYRSYASEEGALVFMSGWMGVDLAAYDPAEPVGDVESNAIQSVLHHLRAEADLGREWSVGDLGRHAAIGGLGPTLVGSGEEIADALQSWVEETDVDGFNLAYAITPGTWEDIIEHVIPVLRARGAYPEGYEPGTLREKLHGRGPRLPDEHRGASHRIRPAATTASA